MSDIEDGPFWESGEFLGRVDRIMEIAEREGREVDYESLIDPAGEFAQSYEEMRDIVNDRELWASLEYRQLMFDWLQQWDLIDDDTGIDEWGDTDLQGG